MTTIYFVRHSKPDFTITDELTRPLSDEGLKKCKKVTDYLLDKEIHKVYSSPYKRAFDTVAGYANQAKLEVEIVNDFRERKVDSGWIEDFESFSKRQWEDFQYRLSDGECLLEVQQRNLNALNNVLLDNANKNVVIGTHGTALSTIVNHFNSDFLYDDFVRIKNLMPFIIVMKFRNLTVLEIEEVIL